MGRVTTGIDDSWDFDNVSGAMFRRIVSKVGVARCYRGRATEKRFTVVTLTGEKAEERLAAEPTAAAELEDAQTTGITKKGLFGRRKPSANNIPGVYGPRVYKPQVYKPGMNIGPSGISFQKPQITGPQLQGPQMKGMNLDANSLKMPGKSGASSAPTGPLLPSQGVFKQKAWLPWWLVPVVIAQDDLKSTVAAAAKKLDEQSSYQEARHERRFGINSRT